MSERPTREDRDALDVKWEWLAQALGGELAELDLKQDYACNCCRLSDGQHQVECPVPYLLQLHVERLEDGL